MPNSVDQWPLYLIFISSIAAAASGLPLFFRSLSPSSGQRLSAGILCLAAVTGIAGAGAVMLRHVSMTCELAWSLPFGPMVCSVDPLSAFFMIPLLVVSACCGVYALGYWPADKHPRNIRKLSLFFGILVASLIWIALAHSAVLFLFAWETMALSSFFVLTTDDADDGVRDAGTLYLICAHASTLCLIALFILLKTVTHSFIFPAGASISAVSPLAAVLFLAGLFGFGIKAGIMPIHIWLPSAHANAPSHVSAIMSGIILKLGIYSFLRLLSFFKDIPLWWGVTLLVCGVFSGIIGVVFAIGQHDLKRLLAYHSIENIGIIMIGIGLAVIGLANHSPLLVLLGMSGALLHVMNHALFKSLLFMGAGSVIHALGTREIDRMGGLLRKMPWTALFFLTGAIAICGLPPLNGFVSELMIYLGLFNGAMQGSGTAAAVSALAAPGLALIGGLALACFVKVFGIVFLGTARCPVDHDVHECSKSMGIAMAVLAGICVLIGVVPLVTVPFLESAVTVFSPSATRGIGLKACAPFGWISILAVALVGAAFLIYIRKLRNVKATRAVTWGCGYLAPTSRMQYTASSFGDMITGLFEGILRPRKHMPGIESHFPAPSRFSSHVPETVLENIYLPFFHWVNDRLTLVRKLQSGKLHVYILYIFLTVIVLLAVPN